MGRSDRYLEQARARFEDVRLEPERFEQYLKKHRPPDAQLAAHAADLYLACACATGDAAALAAFEREHMPHVADFVARTDPSPLFADEVRQALRERLFVGPSPKIGEYAGGGPLGAWLRVAAVRAALNLKRARGKPGDQVDSGEARKLPSTRPDPELDYLKTRYGREFQQAFQRTLSKLSARDKNLLTLYYLESLSSAAIARIFKVHGATVRRWLEDIRKQVIEETYAVLREKLELSPSELSSMLRLVNSQLDVSVTRYLR